MRFLLLSDIPKESNDDYTVRMTVEHKASLVYGGRTVTVWLNPEVQHMLKVGPIFAHAQERRQN